MKEIFTRNDTEIPVGKEDDRNENLRRTVIDILKELGLVSDDCSD